MGGTGAISPARTGAALREGCPPPIDANGVVHVPAKDKGTGREQKITITARK